MRRQMTAMAAGLFSLLLLPVGLATAASPGAAPVGWDESEVVASYDGARIDVTLHALHSTASGHVYATWRAADLRDRDPYLAAVAVRDPATGTWTEPVTYADEIEVSEREIVSLPDGRVVVAYVGTKPRHDEEWSAGFQVVNPDGTLGVSALRSLPDDLDPYLFAPSVSGSDDVVLAMLGLDDLVVLHSAGLGPLERLDVPMPELDRRESIEGILVDPNLAVTVIAQQVPRRAHFGRIRVLELDDAWTSRVLDKKVTHGTDRVAVGRDGNGALTWNSKDRIVVGSRIDGAWSIDRRSRVTGCGYHWAADCGVVEIADGDVVVASWLRSGSSAALARRDPATGTWSDPSQFRSDVATDARWKLVVGDSGDAVLWWPPGVDVVYQCERDQSCDELRALTSNFPAYADAAGSDLVTVWTGHKRVQASTYR